MKKLSFEQIARKQQPLFLILIAIAGVSVYFNTLFADFAWDDTILITNNPLIRQWGHIGKFFYSDIALGGGSNFNYYRPLQMLTYTLDYHIWGLNPFGFHLTNMILHIGVALLIYLLTQRLLFSKTVSFLAAILYVLHPIHTEAVTYIAGRADSMVAIFMLSSFILYTHYLDDGQKKNYLFALLAFILAILSRESALILPALLFLFNFIYKKKRYKVIVPFLLIFLGYAVLRLTVLKEISQPDKVINEFMVRLPGSFVAFAVYLQFLILPYPLKMEYGLLVVSFLEPYALVGLVLFIVYIIATIIAYKRTPRICFLLCWYLIGFLMVGNIFYPMIAYLKEHWLYIPSIGLFIVVGYVLRQLLVLRRSLTLALILLIGLTYGALTIRQNSFWHTPETLYKYILKYVPRNTLIRVRLGKLLMEDNKLTEAETEFRKSLEEDPKYIPAYISLGVLYEKIGKPEKAEQTYKQALEIEPEQGALQQVFADYYLRNKQYKQAADYYEKSIKNLPYSPRAYGRLGHSLHQLNQTEKAIPALENSIKLDPESDQSYNWLGMIYLERGNYLAAISIYSNAIKHVGDSAELYNNLGTAHCRNKAYQEGIASYQKALELNPSFKDARQNLHLALKLLEQK